MGTTQATSLVRELAHVEIEETVADAPSRFAAYSAVDDEINRAVCELVDAEILGGREYGLQVVAYLHGKCIVDVCAGCAAPGEAVTPQTRFMAYSVSKGVSATIISRALDANSDAQYLDPVCRHWPEFAAHGKESVTIAEALSHRAGLRASSLCPLRGLWRALCGDYRALMPSGIQWIASCKPTWSGTEYARYHPVSWSWVAGGIYEHIAQRREPGAMAPHIGEGAAALAKVLKVAESEIQLGEWRRGNAPIAPLVRPRTLAVSGADNSPRQPQQQHAPGWWESALNGIKSWLWFWLGCMECFLFVRIGNSQIFRAVCLPSSNGTYTARAIGAMYGALANDGKLADGPLVLSARCVLPGSHSRHCGTHSRARSRLARVQCDCSASSVGGGCDTRRAWEPREGAAHVRLCAVARWYSRGTALLPSTSRGQSWWRHRASSGHPRSRRHGRVQRVCRPELRARNRRPQECILAQGARGHPGLPA